MPRNVLCAQLNGCDPFNRLQAIPRINQPALHPVWQVGLRCVTRHDNLGKLSHPCQKHFHLSGGCVLGLIENHKRIVQRSPTHEGQRDNFDDVFVEIPLNLIEVEDFCQSIKQRTEERIDLGQHVTR